MVLDYLCGECADHFSETKERLSQLGIPFVLDPKIVRGLDYYTARSQLVLSQHQGHPGPQLVGVFHLGLDAAAHQITFHPELFRTEEFIFSYRVGGVLIRDGRILRRYGVSSSG